MTLFFYVLQQLINALSIGSLYALMAVGLAMVFSILRLINFAHGDLIMIAAYFAAFALLGKLPLGVTIILVLGGTVLVVSNEVGLGIVPDNALARRFRDLAGFANQIVAQASDEAYFLASGMPMRIK